MPSGFPQCCWIPRSNHHNRLRSFTALYGKKRRSYTMAVNDHRIRLKTERNGIRIRRSYKKTENRRKFSVLSVYGMIRCEYFVVNYRAQIFHSRKRSPYSSMMYLALTHSTVTDGAIRLPEWLMVPSESQNHICSVNRD